MGSCLLVPLAVQRWASYYPGAEPGGGGYIAQRVLSKDEANVLGDPSIQCGTLCIEAMAMDPMAFFIGHLSRAVDIQSISRSAT